MNTSGLTYERYLRSQGMKHTPNGNSIVIHCFQGAIAANQIDHFTKACDIIVNTFPSPNIIVQRMTLKNLRECDWNLSQFVDWLADCHIHFITTHVHQGMESFGWTITDIYQELPRLKFHPGFPNLEKLQCPIFTQNKMIYLDALPDAATMPSYKINISNNMDMEATRDFVER